VIWGSQREVITGSSITLDAYRREMVPEMIAN